jgi:hypothetical protein
VALTHHSIYSRRNRQTFTWFFPKPCNRYPFTTVDIVERTWFFSDEEERVWEKPYRHLFQHCFRAIERECSKDTANLWAGSFVSRFLMYNRTFPQPSKHSFLVRDSKRTGKPLSFHTAVQLQLEVGVENLLVDWDDTSLWEVGNAERYLAGRVPPLPTVTASAIEKHVERDLGPIGGRH